MSDEQTKGVEVYNIAGAEPTLGELPHDQVQDAIMSGQFSFPKGKPVSVYNPDGELGELPPEEAAEAFKAGFRYANPMEVREEVYGTPGQMAKTFVEGAAEGVAGPLAPYLEKKLGIAKEEDILARREENELLHGAGQAAGMIAPIGLGGVATKVGKVAAEAAGLGNVAADVSRGYKIGHSAVTQAAEMAVLQGNNEVAKMILNDPKTSAESAIANIGLAAALGGAGGAFITGAVNPLWEATAGPKVESMLNKFREHIDGGSALSPDLQKAKATLGVEIDPIIQAPLSGKGLESYSKLSYAQNPVLKEAEEKLNQDISKSVMDSLGLKLEETQAYSNNKTGQKLFDTFKKEYDTLYEPKAAALEARDAIASKINLSDDVRLDQYGKILEKGMERYGTDSPYYKLYDSYGERMLAKNTVGELNQLKSEINGEIRTALAARDTNKSNALGDIRNAMEDLYEREIEKQGVHITDKMGMLSAEEILSQNKAANQGYRDFAKLSNDLLSHLGSGKFDGHKGLLTKLGDKASPEQLLNKFSPKNNADIIPFLAEHFPETFKEVQKKELLDMLKPALKNADDASPIDVNKLVKIVKDKMAGKAELVDFTLPTAAQEKIMAAADILSSIPKQKDTGTAGGLAKLLMDIPRSALAGVAMISGKSPIMGALVGEMAMRLGKDAPEALRLAHLKFLGSDTPIKAKGFRDMVEFFANTYKGETMLAKAATNLFKRGTQVLTAQQMPSEKDRSKLDKMVTDLQDNPDKLYAMQKGEVGHYLPNHQEALSQTTANALKYLQYIKPQPHILGPLDKPVPPQPIEISRYNRALDIAQQPTVILQHIKDGTMLPSDIGDLDAMYPGLYNQMKQKITDQLATAKADEDIIPYKSRISMALFMGQPLDGTMTPESIMAAQPLPKEAQPMPQPQGKTRRGTSNLGKSNASYMTPNQRAESDRANRD